jgi:hypothetical protein
LEWPTLYLVDAGLADDTVELRLLTCLLCWRQTTVEELNLIHRHRRIKDLALVIRLKNLFISHIEQCSNFMKSF